MHKQVFVYLVILMVSKLSCFYLYYYYLYLYNIFEQFNERYFEYNTIAFKISFIKLFLPLIKVLFMALLIIFEFLFIFIFKLTISFKIKQLEYLNFSYQYQKLLLSSRVPNVSTKIQKVCYRY